MGQLDPIDYDEFGVKGALWDSATVNARLSATFPAHDLPAASVLLAGLVGEVPGGDPEVSAMATARLMLAAIKVSEGSLTKLSLWVQAARMDPRDLIAAAEYPRELREHSQAAREQDFAEYLTWVTGGAN